MMTKSPNTPLTEKQKKFTAHYLKTGNPINSVMAAGYDVKDRKSASVIASENLTRLNVRQYLAEHALPAMERIEELSRNSNNSMVKLLANKDIADRAGFKPVEKTITADITPLLVLPAEIINKAK